MKYCGFEPVQIKKGNKELESFNFVKFFCAFTGRDF